MKKIYLFLAFLFTAKIFTGQIYNMETITNGVPINVTSCKAKVSYGVLGGANNSNKQITFYSGTPGLPIRMNFLPIYVGVDAIYYDFETNFDYLRIYDNATGTGVPIATLTGTKFFDQAGLFYTSTTGYLTIRVNSDANTNWLGFDALIGCQPQNCNSNLPASDACATAPVICELNGYCGNTAGWYTPDHISNFYTSATDNMDIASGASGWGYISATNEFCGSIENNSWIAFVASGTSATFNVTSSGCLVAGSGIQATVYQTSSCGLANTFIRKSPCVSQNAGSGTFGLTATGLTIGQTYYVMVDGFAGNVCDYQVTATSGVATPSISSAQPSICAGLSNTLTAVVSGSGLTYSWTDGSTVISTNPSAVVSPSATMNYTCTITGACGAAASETVQVVVNSAPTANAGSGKNLTCSATSTVLSGSGGGSYSWSGPGIISGGSTATPTVNQPGTYSLVVTTSGCPSAVSTVVVTQNNTPPSVTPASSGVLNCTLTSVNVSATTGATPVSYNWSGTGITGGNGTGTITVNQSGTFNYTVTNTSNGCTTTGSQVVTQNIGNPSVSGAVSGALNCASSSVNVSATTGATPVSYNWSGTGITAGNGTGTITVNQPGTFNYTVTNISNGCSTTGSQVVTQNTTPPLVTSAASGVLNCTLTSVNVSASTGATPVSYNWSGTGITSATNIGTITVNQPGTFNYTVTNTSNGCSTSGSQAVTQNSTPPSVSSGVSAVLNCTLTSVNVNATTGTTPVSYNWSGTGITGGNGTGTITVNQAGTFNFTVTNTSNGCSTTGSQAVTQSSTALSVTPSASGTLNCTVTSVNVSASTAASPVTYNWSGTGITSGNGTGTITVNQPGTFNYTVTNTSNGCSATGSQVVTQNTTTPPVSSAAGVMNCTLTTVNVSATTSATSVSYNWSGTGITSATNIGTITVNQPGTYNYTVTNTSNGCFTTGSQAVTQNTTAPSVTGSVSGVLNCTLTSVNASASTTSSPVSYNWSGTGITGGNGTGTITVNQPGTFNYTVTNTNTGCSVTGSQSVTQNITAPSVTSGASGAINCTLTTVNVNATTGAAPVSYNWSGTGITSATNISTITVNQGGTFNYTVTNTTNGCSTTGSQAVTQNTGGPSVTTNTSGVLNCTLTSVDVSVTTTTLPVSYIWAGTGITSATNISTITVNQGGTYSYTVTNTSNGCASAGSQAVSQNTNAPVTTASSTGSITCVTNTINLNSSLSGMSYTWTAPGGSTIASGVNLQNAVGQGLGTYTLNLLNPVNACTYSTTIAAIQNTTTPTSVNAGPTQTLVCGVATITLTGSATPSTATANWLGGVSSPNSFTTTTGSANTYTLEAINPATGCSISSTVAVISSVGSPSATANAVTNSITCTNSLVAIGVNVTSPDPVTYQWPSTGISGATNNATATATLAGVYNVTITNNPGNNCSIQISITVPTNTTPVTASITPASSITCNTPSVTLSATPVGSQNTYSWAGTGITSGNTSSNPVVNQPGNFVVTVTNTMSGCSGSYTVTVPANTGAPSVSLAATSLTTTCLSTTVTLSATSDSDPASTYSWSPPATGSLNNSNVASSVASGSGIFTVVVTNTVSGCTSIVSQNTVEVVADAGIPSVTLSSNTLAITCSNPTPSVSVTTTATPVTYNWSPTSGIVLGTETTASPMFNSAGSYSVVVTNTASGCATSIVSNVVNVTPDNNPPTVSFTTATNSGMINCTAPSLTVTPVISGGNFTYTWSPSNGISTPINQSTATFTAGGTYTLAITNTITGCISTTTNTANMFTVVQDTARPTANIGAISSNSTIGCGGTNTLVTLEATTNPANANITWSPSGTSSLQFSVTVPGTYSLIAISPVNGCSVTAQYTVNGSTNPPQYVDAGTTVFIPCNSQTIALIGVTATPNCSYSWSGPSATAIITGSATTNPIVGEAGVYTLTVTRNDNGCQGTATVSVVKSVVTAAFTADPTSGISPLTVNFTDASTGASIWTWNFGDSSPQVTYSPLSQNPTNIFNTGTYTVTLIASSGLCSDTASVVIVVENGLSLEIPNVFTPNNDGSNDVFTIHSTGIKEISLQVFNRWGEKLYEFTGPKASWDGLAPNGILVPEGTYFYFVNATGFDDTEIERKGTLNLFR